MTMRALAKLFGNFDTNRKFAFFAECDFSLRDTENFASKSIKINAIITRFILIQIL